MRRILLLCAACVILAGCTAPEDSGVSKDSPAQVPATQAAPAASSPLPPVDLAQVHAEFTRSGAPGAPGPQVAAASYLRALARGDVRGYFKVTGSRVDAAELTKLRLAVFRRERPFTVSDVWNNQGTADGKGLIVPAVAETASAVLFQTTLRVNSVDGAWFVSQAVGTGQPPSPAVRALVDAEALERVRQRTRNQNAVCAKPVIYLYPARTSRVRVRLDVAGTITASAPAYDPLVRGWDVIAEPDGSLMDPETGRSWPYLFWEADARLESGVDGWTVAGPDTERFLVAKLRELGLSPGESASFMAYWLPRMEGNRYNFIRFEGPAYERMARLTVTPRPDTVIRVFMTFTPLEFPVRVGPQDIGPRPVRSGFTLVEWGGREVSAR